MLPRRASEQIDLPDLWMSVWAKADVNTSATAEENLLRRFVTSPFTLGRVPIVFRGGVYFIATLDVNPHVLDQSPIVVAHGAGAGLGFTYRNLDALACLGGRQRRVLAFDWLGCANSSREELPSRGGWFSQELTEDEHIEAVISFFVESFEAWRAHLELMRMDLVAHSLGGYLAAHYAMKYPERVRRLVLSSPAGLGRQPRPEEVCVAGEGRGMQRYQWLWDAGWLNFGTISLLGRLVGRVMYTTAKDRFALRFSIEGEELDLFFEYFWQMTCAQESTADHAANVLLVPIETKVQVCLYGRHAISAYPSEQLARLSMPIAVLFGSQDWIYTTSCDEFVKLVPNAKQHRLDNAGHHLYLDNRPQYHSILQELLS